MSDMIVDQLLASCPRCGSGVFVTLNAEVWCRQDMCLRLPPRETVGAAIEAWNTRAATPVQNRGIGDRLREFFAQESWTVEAEAALIAELETGPSDFRSGYEACREDAARLCAERAAGREQLYAENEAAINAHKAVEAEECATAIRNMEARNG